MNNHYEKQKQEAAEKITFQAICYGGLEYSFYSKTHNNCIEAFKLGSDHEHERAKVLVEALQLVEKFGYGVNIEKNMVIRNTGDVVSEALSAYKGE